ncbi:hypothetical protein [Halorubrum trueperi]|uniref:Uncharacterized protein n=1 Tax=Halorubrum trueperi TaxID=2004704 RepID=A0ABD5UEU8_9EURY
MTPGGPRINVYVHFLGDALSFPVVQVSMLGDLGDARWRERSGSA